MLWLMGRTVLRFIYMMVLLHLGEWQPCLAPTAPNKTASSPGLISAAALGANVGLVGSLYEHSHDVSKEELMELAIRMGNVDFCAAMSGDFTGMKKRDKGVRLHDGC
jgi:hypothetical protein